MAPGRRRSVSSAQPCGSRTWKTGTGSWSTRCWTTWTASSRGDSAGRARLLKSGLPPRPQPPRTRPRHRPPARRTVASGIRRSLSGRLTRLIKGARSLRPYGRPGSDPSGPCPRPEGSASAPFGASSRAVDAHLGTARGCLSVAGSGRRAGLPPAPPRAQPLPRTRSLPRGSPPRGTGGRSCEPSTSPTSSRSPDPRARERSAGGRVTSPRRVGDLRERGGVRYEYHNDPGRW